MNIRNATLAMRNRKNEMHEQERVASLDFDTQRGGGTPSKGKKKEEPKSSKAKPAKTGQDDT
ncbi:hypothetical protein ISP15_16040 [Dyella jejuensis]|uniref:Uncharacterized protein n=1 Tax=Dyella jejuensis TaxID=1432009 RepID=A0ABW8JQ25_9GAMM